jgi:hypothetical protein
VHSFAAYTFVILNVTEAAVEGSAVSSFHAGAKRRSTNADASFCFTASDTEQHHLGGLDQCRRGLSHFQLQLARGIGCNQ